MAQIKKVYDDAQMTNQVYPQTHEKAVIDNNGTTLESKLGQAQSDITGLQSAYAALTQSNIVVVADHTEVSSPAANTIYREQGESSYTDWMYYDSAWKEMATYDNAIDNVPTENSDNLVKSGGVYDAVNVFYDKSALVLKKPSTYLYCTTDPVNSTNVCWYTAGNYSMYVFDVTNYVGGRVTVYQSNAANMNQWKLLTDIIPDSYNSTSNYYDISQKQLAHCTVSVSARSKMLPLTIALTSSAITEHVAGGGKLYLYVGLHNTHEMPDLIAEKGLIHRVEDCEAVPVQELLTKEESIKTSYISTIAGYCKGDTIVDGGTNYTLYLYLLTAGKRYKFTKVAHPEYIAYLVFKLAQQSDFVVGGSSGEVLISGQSAAGDYYYTPTENTYVAVLLKRSNGTQYISEVVECKYYNLSDFDTRTDYDNTPTQSSTHAITSGAVYDEVQTLDSKIDERTLLQKTYTSETVGLTYHTWYNTHGKTVGSSMNTTRYDTTDPMYSGTFPVKKGCLYTIACRGGNSSDYTRPVAIVVNGIIVAMATTNDALTTPFQYTATADGIMYLNCNESYIESFYVNESTPVVSVIDNFHVEKTYPKVFLPKKLYGVVGEKMQLFYRGIIRAWNPYNMFLQVDASGFKSTPRYTQVTPASVGTTSITCNLIDEDYDKSPNVTSTLYSKSVPSTVSSMNVLCMGASTVSNPYCFPVELKRRLCDSGGTPAGLGFSSINFVGRKTVTYSDVHCEATGGWTWSRFTHAGQQDIRFYVTGADTGYIDAIYSFTSSSGTVQVRLVEWNVTESTGNALFEYVTSSDAGKVPTSQTGTLTYVSGGAASSNIAFTDYLVEAANPFWNTSTNELDFQMYADTYCNGAIDVMICSIDTFNDGVVGDSDFTTIFNQMKSFIDAYHTTFPNGKVIIASQYPPNPYYGTEYNYGGTNTRTSWSVTFVRFRWAEACDELCNSNGYSSFCYYANTFSEFDSEYGYPTTQRAVDTRVSDVTETIGTNGVHPTAIGSKMEADAIFRCFVCNILN